MSRKREMRPRMTVLTHGCTGIGTVDTIQKRNPTMRSRTIIPMIDIRASVWAQCNLKNTGSKNGVTHTPKKGLTTCVISAVSGRN
jgi:hypothetical protein